MAQGNTLAAQAPFGTTSRKDNWWAGPLATFLGLSLFIVYATYAGMNGKYFEIRAHPADFSGAEVAPYLSPFYAPLIYDASSPHAWIQAEKPSWWPGWAPFSSAALILAGPGLFRFTCYYYRKAYYRSFWADPAACAVGEPRKTYLGENSFPLIFQNVHRYTMYVATIFLVLLWWDALQAFYWPNETGGHQLGMGLGTVIMVINVICLSGFTFGCNSVRHLVGGRADCFSCPMNGNGQSKELTVVPAYKFWRISTRFNEYHMQWAWVSLFTVGFTDFYIRMCAMGIIKDLRFF